MIVLQIDSILYQQRAYVLYLSIVLTRITFQTTFLKYKFISVHLHLSISVRKKKHSEMQYLEAMFTILQIFENRIYAG